MNLTTPYMGLTLKNPMVASASPLSQSVGTIRQLEDHGASAVVMFSLFEEQIRHDTEALEHFMSVGTDSFGEALTWFAHFCAAVRFCFTSALSAAPLSLFTSRSQCVPSVSTATRSGLYRPPPHAISRSPVKSLTQYATPSAPSRIVASVRSGAESNQFCAYSDFAHPT